MKSEIQGRIDALKAEIAGLEVELNKPEIPTYDDVVAKVDPRWYYNIGKGDIENTMGSSRYTHPDRQTAEREALRAMWLNIAVYVNEGGDGHYVVKIIAGDIVYFKMASDINYPGVSFFKSESAARLAVQIMGEDNFRKMCGVK
jgi:hypothetical protein